jgi:hypothetical protein
MAMEWRSSLSRCVLHPTWAAFKWVPASWGLVELCARLEKHDYARRPRPKVTLVYVSGDPQDERLWDR